MNADINGCRGVMFALVVSLMAWAVVAIGIAIWRLM
jgi:hypothetical protein